MHSSNVMAIAGLACLMLAMVGAVLLVVSVVLGTGWATWATTGVAAAFLLVWYVIPFVHRARGHRAPHSG